MMLGLSRRDWTMTAAGAIGAVIAAQILTLIERSTGLTVMTYDLGNGRMVSLSQSVTRCRELQSYLTKGGYTIETTAPWGEKFSVKGIDCGKWNISGGEPP